MKTLEQKAAEIKLAVFDVDGVLTDGRIYTGPDGESLKVTHVQDGLGLKLLRKAGIAVAVISGRESPALRTRLDELGIEHAFLGDDNKGTIFDQLLGQLQLQAEQAACMGDDLPDLPLLERAGLALTVPDAHPDVMAAADWISKRGGGNGAVREACDLILAAQS